MKTLEYSVRLADTMPEDIDLVIVGLKKTADGNVLIGVDENANAILKLVESLGGKDEISSTVIIPNTVGKHYLVVGLGKGSLTPEEIRKALGNALRKAATIPSKNGLKVAINLELEEANSVKAIVEGAMLGAYEYQKLGQADTPKIKEIVIVSSSAQQQSVETAVTIATSVCQARDWVNMPPNLLYPQSFAVSAQEFLANSPVTVEVLDEKSLLENGYGGILAVGGGSSRKPRLFRMSYRPENAKAHLALVGKGITFDSGGLDLKPATGMYTMKCDMGGGAAVIAAVKAIADLGLKLEVTGYVSMAENMPSGEAYRPSDVLTMYGGKTVENANTDAEGRLVMADALARAGEDNPDLVVDIATLTGACMVALGSHTAGLMASDDETAELLLSASQKSGEPFWRLPITEDIKAGLKSKVADIRSSATTRYGGALTAGAFLWSFVPENIAWAHLDIAGPAFNEGNAFDYVQPGGTGVGVRTLVALAEKMAS